MAQRLTLEEKKDLVGKVDELAKNEKISVKEACKRLDTPYWKYFNALKGMKKGKKKVRAKTKAETKVLTATPVNDELKVELVFKEGTAKLVCEYSEAYGVEPEAVCRILVIDALKDKK
jgi:hypothetical protein